MNTTTEILDEIATIIRRGGTYYSFVKLKRSNGIYLDLHKTNRTPKFQYVQCHNSPVRKRRGKPRTSLSSSGV